MSQAESSHSSLAREVLAISQHMLAAAQDKRWPDVAVLETQRSQISEHLFARPVPEADSEAVRAAITEALSYNPELERLAMQARSVSGDDVLGAQTVRKAVTAYHRFS